MEDNNSTIHDKTLFDAVLNTVSDGIVIIGKDFKILFQNEIIYRAFGSKIDEYCYAAYRGRQEPCENCLIFDVIKDGKPKKGLRNIRLPDGNVLWIKFISEPFTDTHGNIIGAVGVARDVTAQIQLSEECVTLRRQIQRQARFENIITQSKKVKAIFRLIERVAATTSTVLINGESGTGKDLISKAIHFNSDRRDGPFVSINCGAIPENLLESELFGHTKGAFTGAIKDHRGLIETADGGTLFLDEVGEIPLSLQVKFLRFLQDGDCRRVGGTQVHKFDIRILSATNRDLEETVREGLFREDLFFRLSVIPIFLPPLRERREDIPLLVSHLLQRLCDEHHRHITGIAPETLKIFMDYPWPGNVRELENTIEYGLHLTDDGQPIHPDQLPSKISAFGDALTATPGFLSIEEYSRQTVVALQGDHTEAEIARTLGICRKNLWQKRKRWGLVRPGKTT